MRDNLRPPVDEEAELDAAAVRWAVFTIGVVGVLMLAAWIWWVQP